MTSEPTVFLVDDDESLREALEWLLDSVQLPVEAFALGQRILECLRSGTSRLPGARYSYAGNEWPGAAETT